MSKNLIIVRGLPGSGKSTFAKLIAPEANVAADDFFTDIHGNYHYDSSRIPAAHAWCFEQVQWMMVFRNDSVIAVHNVFAQLKHIKPYFELAKAYGYQVTVVHVEGNHGDIHNVPKSAIATFRAQWQPFDPRYLSEGPGELAE